MRDCLNKLNQHEIALRAIKKYKANNIKRLGLIFDLIFTQKRGRMITPPYPNDLEAKGWSLDLDYERIEQSDTWALASPEQRPWLLMLWMTSWRQRPVASFPNDHKLIAARIGMPLAQFTQWSEILLSGWELADDGRLYHRTITEHVLKMVDRRAKDKQRVADYRAKSKRVDQSNNEDHQSNVLVTSDQYVCNALHTRDQRVSSTPTPTPTPTPKEKSKPPIPPKGGEVSQEFAEFWDAYPKKIGKEAAWKVWKKLGSPVATLQNIKTALSWQRECDQWTKDQGQYIPNPATYLNQGRWQDERPEPRNTALTQVGQRAGRSAMQWLENGGYEKGLTQ